MHGQYISLDFDVSPTLLRSFLSALRIGSRSRSEPEDDREAGSAAVVILTGSQEVSKCFNQSTEEVERKCLLAEQKRHPADW